MIMRIRAYSIVLRHGIFEIAIRKGGDWKIPFTHFFY